MKNIPLAFLLLITLGCNGSIVPADQKYPKLNETFELRVGQSATIDGDFSFTFDSVPNDSRCPKNVVCVWEGNALVVLRFSDGTETLNTTSQPHEIVHGSYTFRLVALAPYPEYPQDIPKDAYIAKLSVTKN